MKARLAIMTAAIAATAAHASLPVAAAIAQVDHAPLFSFDTPAVFSTSSADAVGYPGVNAAIANQRAPHTQCYDHISDDEDLLAANPNAPFTNSDYNASACSPAPANPPYLFVATRRIDASEPSSWVMIAAGFGLMGMVLHRHRKAAATASTARKDQRERQWLA